MVSRNSWCSFAIIPLKSTNGPVPINNQTMILWVTSSAFKCFEGQCFTRVFFIQVSVICFPCLLSGLCCQLAFRQCGSIQERWTIDNRPHVFAESIPPFHLMLNSMNVFDAMNNRPRVVFHILFHHFCGTGNWTESQPGLPDRSLPSAPHWSPWPRFPRWSQLGAHRRPSFAARLQVTKKNVLWLVVFRLALWKLWKSQLGWLFKRYVVVFLNVPVTTNQFLSGG